MISFPFNLDMDALHSRCSLENTRLFRFDINLLLEGIIVILESKVISIIQVKVYLGLK